MILRRLRLSFLLSSSFTAHALHVLQLISLRFWRGDPIVGADVPDIVMIAFFALLADVPCNNKNLEIEGGLFNAQSDDSKKQRPSPITKTTALSTKRENLTIHDKSQNRLLGFWKILS